MYEDEIIKLISSLFIDDYDTDYRLFSDYVNKKICIIFPSKTVKVDFKDWIDLSNKKELYAVDECFIRDIIKPIIKKIEVITNELTLYLEAIERHY